MNMKRPDSVNPKHFDELLCSSIDTPIIGLNFKSLSGVPGEDGLSEAANYLMLSDELTRSEHGKSPYTSVGSGWKCDYGHDLQNATLFNDQGCFKADKPIDRKKKDEVTGEWVVDEKKAKYLNQPGRTAQYFALRVSFADGLKIADYYDLSAEYKQHQGTNPQDTEDLKFWAWAITQKTIPLLITEGAKKAACLLSHGFLAIGLPGIYMGCKPGTDTLKPGIALLADGREVIIAFDMDEKPKTQKAVNSAAAKLSAACKAASASVVYRVEWPSNDGKGVDDLIHKHKVGLFENYLNKKKGVKELPTTGLRSTTEDNPCPACGDTSGKCSTHLGKKEDGVLCSSVIDKSSTPERWKFTGLSEDSRGKLYPIRDKSKDGGGSKKTEPRESKFKTSIDAGLQILKKDGEDGEDEWVKIGDHITAIAEADSVEGGERSLVLEFRDQAGELRNITFDKGSFFEEGSASLKVLASLDYS